MFALKYEFSSFILVYKMKLYIHIGTEKTGSSFIQTLFSRNRSRLVESGIYYPKAMFKNQEYKMHEGEISGGNAYILLYLIDHNLWDKIENWFLHLYDSAKEYNCNKVLLTNEVLIEKFSRPKVFEKIYKIIKSTGFSLEEMLIILREPVSQAVSLYKHHSKSGIMKPIDIWLKQKYNLVDILMNFYTEIDSIKLKIKQYEYKKDTKYLIDVFLVDWLNVKVKLNIDFNVVNPSLTFSELILLSEIRVHNKYLAKKYYDFMIQVDKEMKTENIDYERYLISKINNYMVDHNNSWKTIGGKMTMETTTFHYKTVNIKEKHNYITFTPMQYQSLVSLIVYSMSSKFIKERICLIIKNRLFKFIPSHIQVRLINFKKKN